MSKGVFSLMVILALRVSCIFGAVPDEECAGSERGNSALLLSMGRELNVSSGEWETVISARHVDPRMENSTADVKVDAAHSRVECGGSRVTTLRMVVREGAANVSHNRSFFGINTKLDQLLFHHRHGRNVVLFNGGLSAQRIDLDDPFNGNVFTNRPLRDDELFEVRLDKRTVNRQYCQGIGVMVHSPVDVKLRASMYESDGVWMYHDTSIYGKNQKFKDGYGLNIYNLQAGDKIGVMRKSNGTVHFFVNGVDQGPAVTGLTANLYGIYEVRGDAVMATIVS